MNRKSFIVVSIVFMMTVFISACGSSAGQNNNPKNQMAKEENNHNESNENINNIVGNNNEVNNDSSNNNDEVSEEKSNRAENDNAADAEDSETLAQYSSEEIEYARVWLEVIDNKDIDTLNVWHNSKGEQVNQHDDDSVNYPEDAISLGGDAMADGVVTYSGNGDGTINLYDVPSHWPAAEQMDESMEKYTQEIIDTPDKVEIDPGDDEEIEELIHKINIRD